MKRLVWLVLVFAIVAALPSCADPNQVPVFEPNRPRLASFVGVWANETEDQYYRFTPGGNWFLYNVNGQVEKSGEVEFDGEEFELVALDGEINRLTVSGDDLEDEKKTKYKRTDSPSSLISSVEYEGFFNDWYEESNLEGNVLTLFEPDSWEMKDVNGLVLFSGEFYAYADEPEAVYLYSSEDNAYFARLTMNEGHLSVERAEQEVAAETVFSTKENSTVRYFYFKDKGVNCNYSLNSGFRLLRNGGAAFNDAHDYKKMPVTCSISTLSDTVDENGNRVVDVAVEYQFKRTDLPYLAGGTFYNSVRFSQYDYYTGELFYMADPSGNESVSSSWVTEHDGVSYAIECSFSSAWEYSDSDETLARFQGIYHLTMPTGYDGFVICLRPVFNSYSAQISSSLQPAEGTLMMEDVGDDVEKSIFCRIPRFVSEFVPEEVLQ